MAASSCWQKYAVIFYSIWLMVGLGLRLWWNREGLEERGDTPKRSSIQNCVFKLQDLKEDWPGFSFHLPLFLFNIRGSESFKYERYWARGNLGQIERPGGQLGDPHARAGEAEIQKCQEIFRVWYSVAIFSVTSLLRVIGLSPTWDYPCLIRRGRQQAAAALNCPISEWEGDAWSLS